MLNRARLRLPLLSDASHLTTVLRPYRWSIPVVVTGGIVSSAFEGLSISMLIPLLAVLSPASGGGSIAMPGGLAHLVGQFGGQRPLLAVSAAIFALVLLKAAVQSLNAILLSWVNTRIGHDIHTALSLRVLQVSYDFFLDQDPGRLVNIISTDSWRVSDAVGMGFSLLIASGALLVFAILMLLVSWKLLAIVLLGTGLIRLLQVLLVRPFHRLSDRLTGANTILANRMLVIIEAIRAIRVFGQEAREQREFTEASERVRRVLFDLQRATALLSPALEVMQAALFIGVTLSAYALNLRLPVIAAFLVLLYRSEPHLRMLSHARLTLAAFRQSIREVEWLLSAPVPPPQPGASMPSDATITFDKVSFFYPNRPGERPALQQVSFVLPAGRKVALIGRSGSGKSTIVNMICGFLSPTTGTIKVGGVDLASLDAAAWRRQIGLAGQDIDLIDGSVAENIAYGLPKARPDEITRAARHADAEDFIARLPERYDTRVGTKGLNLSGGQRQRIGIARAIIREPRILILDEATNAVDGLSESRIIALLREHLPDVTVIVVSHRASTLTACDDAVVIEDGRVVEAGPMSDLQVGRAMALPDART